MPQAPDAEKAMLSCVLLAPNRVISEFVERGSDEFFNHPAHRTIYRHMLQMWTDRKAIGLVTLTQSLEDSRLLDEVGGPAYITELFNVVPTASLSKEYIHILREKWIARTVIQVTTEIQEAAFDPSAHPDLESRAQEGLVKITSMFESKAKTHGMGDLVLRALDRYEENHRKGGGIVGLSTGIAPLDKVDMCAMTDGGFSQRDLENLSHAAAELSNAPIYVRDEAIMSPLQFRAAARKLVVQHGCRLLVVDYVQLMEPSNRTDSRERQVAECSRTIKTTAAELKIPIIVLAQLNDDGRSRESRAIEQDSNEPQIHPLLSKDANTADIPEGVHAL